MIALLLIKGLTLEPKVKPNYLLESDESSEVEEEIDSEKCYDAFKALSDKYAETATISSTPATPTAGTPEPGTPTPGTPEAGTPTPGTPEPGTPTPGTPEAGTPTPGTTEAGTPTPGTTEAGTPTPGTTEAGTPTPGTTDAATSTAATSDAATSAAATSESVVGGRRLLRGNGGKLRAYRRKLLASTETELLSEFEKECKATAAREACSNLLPKLKVASPTIADKADFADKCKVVAQTVEGNNGLPISTANTILFILSFAIANIYFKL
jgi:hypothetical protein